MEVLKLLKESEFLLKKELAQKIFQTKNLEEILEKELKVLLSRKERTIKKRAAYLFNLFMVLAQFKNKNLVYNIVLLSNYSNKFLENIFGEFLEYFDSICFEVIDKKELFYYENIKGKSSKINLSMIVALVQKYRFTYDKEKKQQLEKYIIDIANENSIHKDYVVLKLIAIMENGYPKAIRNFNAATKKMKKECTIDLLEQYLDGEKERERKNKKNSGNIVFKKVKKINELWRE